MIAKGTWHLVTERKRTYHFPGGNIVFHNIDRIRVSESHTHYLEGRDGKKYIVRNTWVALEIDGDWIDP